MNNSLNNQPQRPVPPPMTPQPIPRQPQSPPPPQQQPAPTPLPPKPPTVPINTAPPKPSPPAERIELMTLIGLASSLFVICPLLLLAFASESVIFSVSFIFPKVGLIFSIIGWDKAKKDSSDKNQKLALAGIITSGVAAIGLLVWMILKFK